jgi:hypothetical protein
LEVALEPGEVYVALNGSGLQVDVEKLCEADSCLYPVYGAATLHGRGKLAESNGKIDRTLVRGNTLLSDYDSFSEEEYKVSHFERCSGDLINAYKLLNFSGSVGKILDQPFRGNLLKR